MAVTTEYGVAREVWFGTVAAGTPQHSFLIRDDTYQKSGSRFSKAVSLGQPVNLSGNANWRQDSWEGGVRQDIWNDRAMFQEGNLDGDTQKGKLKMWPGWKSIPVRPAGHPWIDRYCFSTSALPPGTASLAANESILWVGEGARKGVVGGAYQLIQYRTGSDAIFGMYHPPTEPNTGPIMSITPMITDDGASNVLAVVFGEKSVGGNDGRMYLFFEKTGIWARDINYSGQPQLESAAVFGTAMFFLVNKTLWKRTPAPNGFGITGTYVAVKAFTTAGDLKGLCVWNNRLWFATNYPNARAALMVSDGTSTNQSISWPNPFTVTRMMPHYGALYILGYSTNGVDAGGTVLQVWKFTGQSLTLLYQEGMGEDGEMHDNDALTALGPVLYWGHNGCSPVPVVNYPYTPLAETTRLAGSGRRRPGLMGYNAETDSVFEGPSLAMDASSNLVRVSNAYAWNNTIAASFSDTATYAAHPLAPAPTVCGFVRRNDQYTNDFKTPVLGSGMATQPLDRFGFVTSSRFDGAEVAEDKVWLRGRFFVRLEKPNCHIKVYVRLNQSPTDVYIGQIDYLASDTGFRSVTLPVKANGVGAYLSSRSIQYKLELHNVDQANLLSQATPIVDNVDVEYVIAPTKRREWSFRVVATDAQVRLDGTTPNPLITAATMVQTLEDLWAAHSPVLFYDADTDDTPGAGVEVEIKNFVVSQYRVTSDDTTVNSEIALTLQEVVNV